MVICYIWNYRDLFIFEQLQRLINLATNRNDEYGYEGRARMLLKKYNIKPWTIVKLRLGTVIIEGVLLPAPVGTDDVLYLKLPNGYNVAFTVEKINEIVPIKTEKIHYKIPEREIKTLADKPNVAIIGAGGTIASRVEYSTGAIKPAFSIFELANAIPEIFEIANIESIELFNILSEDMRPEYWISMAKKSVEKINAGVDGIVITHGTDTMQFSASALAFMIEKLSVPIVFTGAQRSSDRPASDAAVNVISAVLFASRGEIAESTVCMHATIDDLSTFIHRGVRVRKMHSSRRDAFRTIGDKPLAMIKDRNINYIKSQNAYLKRGKYDKSETYAKAVFERKTALIYVYPYMNGDIIETLIDKGYKGIVLAGTGLGHVPDVLLPVLTRAIEEGIIVTMTTQCIWGPVRMDVYERGRVLKHLGLIPADGILPETAFVKLGWLLGQNLDNKQIAFLLQSNLRFEKVERESIDCFFNN